MFCYGVVSWSGGKGAFEVEIGVNEDPDLAGAPGGYVADVPGDTTSTEEVRVKRALNILQVSKHIPGFLGDTEDDDDEDWYRTTLDRGVRYRISVIPNDNHEQDEDRLDEPKIAGLYKSDGSGIAGTSGVAVDGRATVYYSPDAPGEYFVSVGAETAGGTGGYILCVDEEEATSICHPAGEGPDIPIPDEPDLGPPSAPFNLSVTGGDGLIEASWQEPSDSGGSEIIYYRVQWREASTQTDWEALPPSQTQIASDPNFTINGLISGDAYEVRVAANNFFDTSGWSATATATPRGTTTRWR